MMSAVLLLVVLSQVEPVPLPPPVDTPALEGTVSAEPPKPPHRPWWDLGVQEKTYRALLPEGPSEGTLSTEQRALFWERYSDLRRESFALDAAQLGLLAVPPLVALAGACVVPFLGLPWLSAFTQLRGSGISRVVAASYSYAPIAGLAAIAAAGMAGLVFSGLMTWDARDVGNPAPPLKMTKDARRAYARAEQGSWKHVALAGSVAAVSVLAGLGAFIVPFALPFVLAPLVGAGPRDVVTAYVGALGNSGALQAWSVIGGFAAMLAITTGIPALAALMYLAQAAPAPGDANLDDETEAGDNRDISDLNPLKGLFGGK